MAESRKESADDEPQYNSMPELTALAGGLDGASTSGTHGMLFLIFCMLHWSFFFFFFTPNEYFFHVRLRLLLNYQWANALTAWPKPRVTGLGLISSACTQSMWWRIHQTIRKSKISKRRLEICILLLLRKSSKNISLFFWNSHRTRETASCQLSKNEHKNSWKTLFETEKTFLTLTSNSAVRSMSSKTLNWVLCVTVWCKSVLTVFCIGSWFSAVWFIAGKSFAICHFYIPAGLSVPPEPVDPMANLNPDERHRLKMHLLVSSFTREQLNRYEMFKRSTLSKPTLRKVLQQVTGSQVGWWCCFWMVFHKKFWDALCPTRKLNVRYIGLRWGVFGDIFVGWKGRVWWLSNYGINSQFYPKNVLCLHSQRCWRQRQEKKLFTVEDVSVVSVIIISYHQPFLGVVPRLFWITRRLAVANQPSAYSVCRATL